MVRKKGMDSGQCQVSAHESRWGSGVPGYSKVSDKKFDGLGYEIC